jgi:2',3'-cyclic-nucleotide 2'-phosphodiesterase (5'-nucleotidase family)
MILEITGLIISLTLATSACSDRHDHSQKPFSSERMTNSRSSTTKSVRPLQWGDVQILHTTDIHGWYQGHQGTKSEPEPNYSGDWGDFASFVKHMRALAESKGVDLLLVDSGDLHDGAGLSDGFPPGEGPDAHFSNKFHSMVDYDLLTVGNHELYVYENALDTFKNFVPLHHGRYLASNVNITYIGANNKSVTEPMGQRFAKYSTALGRKVTSLGVLFDFHGQAKDLTIQPPNAMIHESWFQDVIREKPDFFLLAGHMPVRDDDWPVVVNAIRAVHSDVPVIIAGGHTHVRDCYIYDDKAIGIESGRYLETVGWLCFNLTSSSTSSSKPFSRTYIDANRRNYAFHANLSSQSMLSTSLGRSITHSMDQLAQSWNLTRVFGNSPEDYYLDRVDASSPSSLLNLLTRYVLPTVISTSNPNKSSVPNIVIANSGSQRFDIYQGPFTKNSQYIVSPFKDDFLFFEGIPLQYANQIVGGLNKIGASTGGRDEDSRVQDIYRAHNADSLQGVRVDAAANLTLGYVTKDNCPGHGDDTEHTPLPYTAQPDFVVSPLTNNITEVGLSDPIDVVFLDFALNDVVKVLNSIQVEHIYKAQDAAPYNSLNTQDLYKLYAIKAWT